MHAEQLWLVSFSDDDDRELTTEEVARALGRHEVSSSTLAWREGLASWHPLSAFEEFSGQSSSSPGFIWPTAKSDAPPPVIEPEPVTVKSIRPPLPGRKTSKQRSAKSTQRSERAANNNSKAPMAPSGLRREKQAKELTAAEEELDANDLLWLPADSEPVSSDFLGLSRPDASLIPPPINVPAPDPLGAREGKAGSLEAAMALRVRVLPMPDIAVTTRPIAKDTKESIAPTERKSVACLPWVIAASLITAGGYFLITEPQMGSAPRAASPSLPAPVEHIATPNLPPPAPAVANPIRDLPSVPPPVESPAAIAEPTPVAPVEVAKPEPVVADAPPTKAVVEAPRPRREPAVEAKQEEPSEDSAPARRSSATVSSLQSEPQATEPFDRAAAMAALDEAAARASVCRKEGDPSGTAEVRITFSTSGRATQAVLSGPPFSGTTTGSCIATAMRAARVPAFLGERTTVQKRVVIK